MLHQHRASFDCPFAKLRVRSEFEYVLMDERRASFDYALRAPLRMRNIS
jgi:hypothetical protein